MKKDIINVLLVEDNPDDVVLLEEMIGDLQRDDQITYNLTSANCLSDAIKNNGDEFDVLLLDLTLPDSTGLDSLSKILEHKKNTPIIVLTGLDDEELAMMSLQKGAQDYLVKVQINSILLMRSISYAIERFNISKEKEKVIEELQSALGKIKTLSGLLPICSNCKKIRNDEGYWERIENYIKDHSNAEFTHGICPDCVKKLYPELYS